MENTVTPIQVKNYWTNQAWEKYKAVRQLQNHTGGGDGDDDQITTPDDDASNVEDAAASKVSILQYSHTLSFVIITSFAIADQLCKAVHGVKQSASSRNEVLSANHLHNLY